MTAGELIEILKDFSSNTPVQARDLVGEYWEASHVYEHESGIGPVVRITS